MMVRHVAERDFPDVEQHHGGTVQCVECSSVGHIRLYVFLTADYT